jgi:hypothetical protein
MGEDLFGSTKELSRADKMRASRKITTDLTKDAIEFLNKSGCFKVWRNNNMPSTRIYKEKEWMDGELEDGSFVRVKVEITKTAFKKGNTKVSTFDIIGFRLSDGMHLEIEVKTKDKLDEDQAKHLVDLKNAGCISFVISNMFTLKHQIEPFMIRKLAF